MDAIEGPSVIGFINDSLTDDYASQLGFGWSRSGVGVRASQDFFIHPDRVCPSYYKIFGGLGGFGSKSGAVD